ERLQEIASHVSPMDNIFLSKERARLLQAAAPVPDTKEEELRLFHLASELLNAGQNQEALQKFEELERMAKMLDPEGFLHNRTRLKLKGGLCWLRIGEITNCVADHNAESCLAPIQGRGIHRFQEGSRNAMQILTEVLQHEPGNLTARWLLNVASM